jgi:plasmid stabilization system protein ParE
VTLQVELHEDADLEMNEAAAYYDRESANLGGIFLDAVAAGFGRIGKYPESGSELRGGARKLALPKFPFTIIYLISADHIRILAIAHQRKRPFYWKSRLGRVR